MSAFLDPVPSRRFPWRVFWFLFAAALCGGLAVMPYVMVIFEKRFRTMGSIPKSLPVFLFTQTLQFSLIFGIVLGLGLWLAPKVNLRAPTLEAWLYHRTIRCPRGFLRAALLAGIVLGLVSLALQDFYLLPSVAAWPSDRALPAWKRLLPALYTAVNEEALVRLFFFSLLFFIMQKIARRSVTSSSWFFWTCNGIAAVLCSLLYLPSAAVFIPLTHEIVMVVTGVNFLSGLVFGYLAWGRGLECAMLAHLLADLILRGIGPFFAPR